MQYKLLIFGLGDYAELVAHYFSQCDLYSFVGFAVDDEYFEESLSRQVPVFKYSEIKERSAEEDLRVFSAVGYKNMRARERIYKRLKCDGFKFASYISPGAYVDPDASIMDNCIVMPNVTLERNVVLRPNCIVWSGATICHDAVIGDHSFVAANCVVGGNSVIGNLSFLAFSSVVAHNLRLADETLLCAGSVMLEDSVARSQYVGSPAVRLRGHRENGIEIT